MDYISKYKSETRVSLGIEFSIQRTYLCQKFGLKFLKFSTDILNIFKKIQEKILSFYGFLTIGIFSGFMRNPRDSRFLWDLSSGSGFYRGMGYAVKKPPLV